ncbi:MAG: hypothetical protein M1831_006291 [Alyxoria varia]|nr:MAG: hypothetical protein M1831_006291 [Alyxoria varia]
MRVTGEPADRIQSVLDDILGERNQGLNSMRNPCRNLHSTDQDPTMAKHLEFSNGVWNMLRSTFVFWLDAPRYENPYSLRFYDPGSLSNLTLSISQHGTYVRKNGTQISRKFDLHESVQDRFQLLQFLFQRVKGSKKSVKDMEQGRRVRKKVAKQNRNHKVQKKNTAEHRMRQALRYGGKENLTARYRTINTGPAKTAKDHKPLRPSPLGLWNVNISSSGESTLERKGEKTIFGEG